MVTLGGILIRDPSVGRFQHSQHPGLSVIGPDKTFEYNLVFVKVISSVNSIKVV